jgi:3-dehydroquinate synthase
MNTVQVDLAERTYPIHIGADALSLLNTLESILKASSLVLVTNHTVQALYGERVINSLHALKKPCIAVILPDGEQYKTAAQLDMIHTTMLQAHCDRKAVIVALGGGVVGDVAGFAAATYMRGIAFVQLPTTLLAQVDSSVGGKTAINHPQGKNMIGAFYQPQAVLADSSVLTTLAAREISAGLAEIIKYGCMADAVFFDWLFVNIPTLMALDNTAIAYAVQRSCELKAHTVAQDETESSAINIRALLNFGHTFGHAFEAVLGYGTWLHGEAVGYGMICAAMLSHELGLLSINAVERIQSLVAAAGLPTQWPQAVSLDAAMLAMQIDKKTEHGVLKFIVLEGIGQAHVRGVDESVVRRVIAKLQTHQP